ncbi:MAG: FoF1 ATP synthase subunit delta/epsilon [Eubacteriales bacterium]
MKTFRLQIAAPDGMRYDGEAVQISVRGIEGELAVLAGHIPFVTALKSGECRVYPDDATIRRASCSGGMLMVSADCVRLLSSDFTWEEG